MTRKHEPELLHARSLLLFSTSALVCLVFIACQPQVQGPSQVPTGDAGSTPSDAATGTDSSSGNDSGPTPGCGTECNNVQYTACTCDPSDPCNWAGDGYCDQTRCEAVLPGASFDDSSDCGGGGPTDCGSECSDGQYTACTCASTDPCGWAGDDYCDNNCEQVLPGAWFDDDADCGGGGPTDCGSECTEGRYTTCTCASSDPCSWTRDGYCDNTNCQQVLPSDHFDDSHDCGGTPPPPPTGDETWAVTMVADDLDNNDGYIMETGLGNLGYGEGIRDTNVTTSTLGGYLAMDLTALYHTGHGLEGQVVTANGGFYPSSGVINVHNTIFATCLTLADSWSSAMGATAETVLGYTEVSYDYTDDDVASSFLSQLGSGYNYMQAWYLANANVYSLADRWAGYVREGGSVVEYSARTNNKPAGVPSLAALDIQLVGDKLWVAPSVLNDPQTFPLAADEIPLAVREAPRGGFAEGGWGRLTPGLMTSKQAVIVAQRYVERVLGGLGDGALLEGVTEVTARHPASSPVVVGHIVRYGRTVRGLPVSGNRIADHVTLLVSSTGVVAWSRYWPTLAAATPRPPATLLPAGEALRRGATPLAGALKKRMTLVRARPVYGTTGVYGDTASLVPAWEYTGKDGSRVVLDAHSGQPLR